VKEPVDHIIRPLLPWRRSDTAITECGYNARSVQSITRDEFFRRIKDLGQQRTAMMTCMTCAETAARWGTWDDDPRRALDREIAWEYRSGYPGRTDRGNRLKDELLAVETLIAAHREEFDSLVNAAEQRREWNERKADMSKRTIRRDRSVL